ncbi:MAG: hypothetical protein V3W20_00575 [Candidatus Neomarinimicrobiota bacterium]
MINADTTLKKALFKEIDELEGLVKAMRDSQPLNKDEKKLLDDITNTMKTLKDNFKEDK